MLRFIARRLVSMVLVLFSISVLSFLIFFATPGVDPAARIAGRNADQRTLAAVRHDFGLDRPLPIRYALMMKKLFITRDLTSYVNRGAKVIPQVTAAAPVTLSLVLGAAVIWVVVSIGMGMLAGVFRGTWIDTGVMVVGLIGISMPVFWLGEVVNLFTQSRLHGSVFSWVPPLGYIPFSKSPFGWFKSLIFPWITLSILYIGIYARVLSSAIVEAQEEDYVRTARAKGLRRPAVTLHAFRNSLLPIVTLLGLNLPLLFSGALVVEVIFQWPGMGQLAYTAAMQRDYTVLMALVVVSSVLVVVGNLLADVVYGLLDPRVGYS